MGAERVRDESLRRQLGLPVVAAAVALALYIAVAEKQGTPPSDLRGTIQTDILNRSAKVSAA